MARKKLVRVRDLDKGRTRLAAVKSINAALDLGNGLTIENYEAEVGKTKDAVELYNTTLSTIDDLYNTALARIESLKDWNERMLNGVASKYGTNSSEYEMAGGVRKSERKKPVRKVKA
ncbi:hypothetical protein [Flavobacterium sp. N1994]|uniref:hypothetical protein n=1 Tax=Flavobacterium sp. N1994 TaxID=2986827 RepID=UPI002221959B|nr:hypothetical protein [Flavobacterium sp. N1994]